MTNIELKQAQRDDKVDILARLKELNNKLAKARELLYRVTLMEQITGSLNLTVKIK